MARKLQQLQPLQPDIPVIRDFDPFDPVADANFIYITLQGRINGSREGVLIDILAHRSNRQRQEIAAAYLEGYRQDLVEVLKAELGSQMVDVVTALFMSPDVYDAVSLHEALQAAEPDEETLIEIICTRTNAELMALRDAYTTLYQSDLVEDFTCKSAGDFRRFLMAIVLGIRDEVDEAADPIQLRDQARMEAQLLYEPISEKLPSSQLASTFVIMLSNPSYPQLRQNLQEFEKLVKMDTEKFISRSVSGNVAPALLSVVRIAKNREAYFANLLHIELQNMASDDKRLIRLIVSRSEKDLGNIMKEYEKLFKVSLDTIITGDNVYGPRSALAALVRG